MCYVKAAAFAVVVESKEATRDCGALCAGVGAYGGAPQSFSSVALSLFVCASVALVMKSWRSAMLARWRAAAVVAVTESGVRCCSSRRGVAGAYGLGP